MCHQAVMFTALPTRDEAPGWAHQNDGSMTANDSEFHRPYNSSKAAVRHLAASLAVKKGYYHLGCHR